MRSLSFSSTCSGSGVELGEGDCACAMPSHPVMSSARPTRKRVLFLWFVRKNMAQALLNSALKKGGILFIYQLLRVNAACWPDNAGVTNVAGFQELYENRSGSGLQCRKPRGPPGLLINLNVAESFCQCQGRKRAHRETCVTRRTLRAVCDWMDSFEKSFRSVPSPVGDGSLTWQIPARYRRRYCHTVTLNYKQP